MLCFQCLSVCMIVNFIAVATVALWLPNLFNFNFSQWFPTLYTQPVVVSPLPTTPPTSYMPWNPTQAPFPTLMPSPTPTVTPKPTVKPTPKPTARPTSAPASGSTISASSVLTALNNYRAKNGVAALSSDQKLQDYAQGRANYLKSIGRMDNHAQFNDFVQNQDGFSKLGINSLAENQSWNYKGTADGLISEFYGSSPGHNQNQLNGTYTHVGIGISGVYTDLVFGGGKR